MKKHFDKLKAGLALAHREIKLTWVVYVWEPVDDYVTEYWPMDTAYNWWEEKFSDALDDFVLLPIWAQILLAFLPITGGLILAVLWFGMILEDVVFWNDEEFEE